MEAFFVLLDVVREAHRSTDDDLLRRAYAFAGWAHHQRRGSSLWNAADVGFYEHLFDDWSLRAAVAPWVTPHVAQDLRPLWEDRLSEAQMLELTALMQGEPPSKS